MAFYGCLAGARGAESGLPGRTGQIMERHDVSEKTGGTAGGSFDISDLYALIDSRRGADPESSYTARLFAAGLPKVAQKVGEEATETVIAALAQSRDALIAESADLVYHLLVLWAAKGVTPQDVYAELEKRRK